jgi:hypothetical protein
MKLKKTASEPVAVEPLIETDEMAKILGVRPNTLESWRSSGRVAVPYIKLGRSVRYRPSTVLAFFETQSQTKKVPV